VNFTENRNKCFHSGSPESGKPSSESTFSSSAIKLYSSAIPLPVPPAGRKPSTPTTRAFFFLHAQQPLPLTAPVRNAPLDCCRRDSRSATYRGLTQAARPADAANFCVALSIAARRQARTAASSGVRAAMSSRNSDSAWLFTSSKSDPSSRYESITTGWT
jgi:hypothetical protein